MDQVTGDNQRVSIRPEPSPTAWHEAVINLPNPHPLQSWQWGAFKERWGWSALPLFFSAQDHPAGTPPLAAAMVLKRKVPRLPFSILYVPKGPLLDFDDARLRQAVVARLEQLARKEKAIFIKIDPDLVLSSGLENEQPSPTGSKFVQELKTRGWRLSDDQIQFRNTVELDLKQSEEALLAAMKQKTRYNIRLAGRREVAIRQGTADDFEIIARMYGETAARDQFAVRPIEYYLDAWQTFYNAGMAQPFLAEYQGRPLGAVIIVRYGKRAIYMYGASTNQERKRMPNYLLQWEAIRWAKAEGCEVYDFWGAPDDFVDTDPLWGVWRFTRGFNGQVVRHIGAWDYPVRPFWYQFYTNVMPKYLDLLRSRSNT